MSTEKSCSVIAATARLDGKRGASIFRGLDKAISSSQRGARKTVWRYRGLALLGLIASALAAPVATANVAYRANPTTGTYAGSIYWMDWSGYNIPTSGGSQDFNFTLADGSTLSLTLTRGGASTATIAAQPTPTYSGAAMGNSGYCFPTCGSASGAPNVVLYSTSNIVSNVSFTLSNIVLKNPGGNQVQNYQVVMADGESTDTGDGASANWTYTTTGGNWSLLEKVAATGTGGANITLTGVGSQTVTQPAGGSPVPSWILATASPGGSGFSITAKTVSKAKQGIMLGMRLGSVTLTKNIAGRSDPSDQFVYDILNSAGTSIGAGSGSCASVGSCTTTGAGTGNQIAISAAVAQGNTVTLKEAMAAGSAAALDAYTKTIACSNSNTGSATVLPASGAYDPTNPPQITVTDVADVISCTITNSASADMQAVNGGTQTATIGVQASIVTSCINNGPNVATAATCTISGGPAGAVTTCTPPPPVTSLAVNGSISCTTVFTPTSTGTITLTTTAGSNTPDPAPSNNAATTTVTVTANIQPVADSGTATAGTASTPIANVAANDKINGQQATLGASGNATVAQSGTWPGGLTLDPATGKVNYDGTTAPGTYSLVYQLCDKSTPANCATTTDTVTINANIQPVTDSGTATAGTASTPIANVAANDKVKGQPATLGASGNATVAQSGTWPNGLTLDPATGKINYTGATAPGTYSLVYQLCDKNTPANCAPMTDTVTINANIQPTTDTGTATAGTASTPIANVAANDKVNGQQATLGASGNATVAQSGTWPNGLTLDPATGKVNYDGTTAPGTYSAAYQLCDKNTPQNCAPMTDTVTINANIQPATDTGTATAGTASTPIANVAANDKVNGQQATLGASGNATVAQSGTWPNGLTLDPATGKVNYDGTTAPGTYSVAYQLCDKNTPANCAPMTDTVTINASIQPVADTGTATAGTASTPIANVAANDKVNGQQATLGAGGNATVSQSGTWPSGITLDPATGKVTYDGTTAPGTYSVAYQLCDKNTPPNCATVTDTVTVSGNIAPVADTGTATAGTASTPIANVAANDKVNGQPATLGASGNATVAQSGTWPNGITLDPATGKVNYDGTTAPGTYSVAYQLCDKNTPPNCATVTDTVTVSGNIAPVADTGSATAGTASTPIANVAANDKVNGQQATLGASGNATVAQSGTWPNGLTLDPATGKVNYDGTTAPGTYSLVYQLCDKNTPPDCAPMTDTVTISANIQPTADTGTATKGTASTPIANVAANDKVNGQQATLGASGNATVAQSGTWPSGITLDPATGKVNYDGTTAPGTYSVAYQLCDKNTPANCATMTDTVTVITPPSIDVVKTLDASVETPIVGGQTIRYVLTATNEGDTPETSYKINEVVPANTTFAAAIDGTTTAATTCAAGAPAGTLCKVIFGTVPAKANGTAGTATVIVSFTVTQKIADGTLFIANQISVPANCTGQGCDPAPLPPGCSATDGGTTCTPPTTCAANDGHCAKAAVAIADLTTSGPTTVGATIGTSVSVQTTCTNDGPNAATNASCVVTGAPAGAQTVCTPTSPVASLANGAAITCTTTFTPTAATPIVLATTTGSDTPDPNTQNNSTTTTVSPGRITVNPDSATTPFATPVTIDVTANDVASGSTIDKSSVAPTQPAHGSVSCNTSGQCTYTPASGYSGADSFTYKVCDTSTPARCGSTTVSVSVGPKANDDTATTSQGSPVNGNVSTNDVYPSGSTFSATTQPGHGSMTMNPDGSYTYTPAAGYNGQDTFTYTVCAPPQPDPKLCSTATVHVTVQAPNVFDPPFITKAASAAGAQSVSWTIVVDNNRNATAQNVGVRDPLPAQMIAVSGSVTCVAYGSSTVSDCYFDVANNRLVADTVLGPDLGQANPATAPNRVEMIFQAKYVTSPVPVTNTALACFDPQNSAGGAAACTQSAAGSATYTPSAPQDPPVPAPLNSRWMLILLGVMFVATAALRARKAAGNRG